LSQHRIHTSGAALQHRSDHRAAFCGSQAGLVVALSSPPVAEFYTYSDAARE
jgi:hypothetical protein